jgi:hypothetical protein
MSSFFAKLIAELLRVLLPILLTPPASTIETGAREPECLRDRLTDSIRKAGWLLCLCLALIGGSGCATRGIIIPPGEPVRLRRPATLNVWLRPAAGQPVPGRIRAPAGWFVLPDPDEVSR